MATQVWCIYCLQGQDQRGIVIASVTTVDFCHMPYHRRVLYLLAGRCSGARAMRQLTFFPKIAALHCIVLYCIVFI